MIFPAFVSVIIVSVVSFVGVVALVVKDSLLKKYIFVLVSLAIGALLGDAFIHLIPESFEQFNNPSLVGLLVIGGMLIFFLLEKVLHWHHSHGVEKEGCDHVHPVGSLILISDGVHNLLDGFIIGVAYLASFEVGVATTVAVILHEIPQEIADFGVLIHAGYSKKRALWMNFISALCAVIGTTLAFWLESSQIDVAMWIIPLAAGGFIYIAASDLIPELHKTTSGIAHALIQMCVIAVGVSFAFGLLYMESNQVIDNFFDHIAIESVSKNV